MVYTLLYTYRFCDVRIIYNGTCLHVIELSRSDELGLNGVYSQAKLLLKFRGVE